MAKEVMWEIKVYMLGTMVCSIVLYLIFLNKNTGGIYHDTPELSSHSYSNKLRKDRVHYNY